MLCVGAFVFTASVIVWFAIKKTIGIRVSLREEIQGLDVNEHGNQAYPEYIIHRPTYTAIMNDYQMSDAATSKEDDSDKEKEGWL